nr:l-type lectin-like domain-containing protein [Quercus suber]
MQSRWFDYGGDTVIRADSYVRLTSQNPSQAGWIYSRVPLTATNWEIEVEFKISGNGGGLFGDGMALWVTKSRAEMGPVFGMKDNFEGLGLFFDTYKNNRPGTVFPYVMAMLGDGQTSYEQSTDGKPNEAAGCSARGIRNADFPTKARITYWQDKELSVDLIFKKEDEWTKCFSLKDIKLPSTSYLGFSAETGELSDNHDIIKVETRNLYSPTGQTGTGEAGSKDYSRSKGRPVQPKEGGSWFWFFTKIVLFLLVVVGAVQAFLIRVDMCSTNEDSPCIRPVPSQTWPSQIVLRLALKKTSPSTLQSSDSRRPLYRNRTSSDNTADMDGAVPATPIENYLVVSPHRHARESKATEEWCLNSRAAVRSSQQVRPRISVPTQPRPSSVLRLVSLPSHVVAQQRRPNMIVQRPPAGRRRVLKLNDGLSSLISSTSQINMEFWEDITSRIYTYLAVLDF